MKRILLALTLGLIIPFLAILGLASPAHADCVSFDGVGCRGFFHVNDEGYDGPFDVKCRLSDGSAVAKVVLENENTESGAAKCPATALGVVAVRIPANYVVSCTNPANGAHNLFGHPDDGSWHNLGDPVASTDIFWHCVTQVY